MAETDAAFTPAEAELLEQFRQGNRRALARVISKIDDGVDAERWLAALEPAEPRRRTIGITGPPGAGKSTLIGSLIPELRKRDLKVAVVAVDPDSPFTGGALLGDRIRMTQQTANDDGVFIRSISSRGSAGGISRSARSICRLLQAFGFDYVILETVGAGQAELSVMDAADIVLLVLVPGTGDAIQWEKAGQVEIADVFALNKADLPGIDALEGALRATIEPAFLVCPSQKDAAPVTSETTQVRKNLWDGPPPIIRTRANAGEGIAAVCDALIEALERLARSADPGRSPLRRRLRAGLEEEFTQRMRLIELQPKLMEGLADSIGRGDKTLQQAVAEAWRVLSNGMKP